MAAEHHRSIIILIENELYGSAFSLVRPMFEATVKGIWLHNCATSNDIKRYKKAKTSSTFTELIRSIENIDVYNSGLLTKIQTQSWKAMHDYVHTGIRQISRRMTEEFIEPNYADDEIIEVISFSNTNGYIVAIATCYLANDAEHILEIGNGFNKYLHPTN
ncbi:MAG: DUF5677 domain-containing protein [Rhodospirillales bacterium]|nr:DUF5677 domain-containing protein [Rhodospirillales bacterium]